MSLKFVARAEGDLKAVATLSVDLRQQIQTQERGSILVPVVVTDETGKEPIQCEMEWAWTTKSKKADTKTMPLQSKL
jgi:hypothetical protein